MKKIELIGEARDKKYFGGRYAKYAIPRNKKCLICGKKVHRFFWSGKESECAREHDIACMGIRRGTCPFCGAKDKERWMLYVLEHYMTKGGDVLHFAPERTITTFLKNNSSSYVSGDVVSGRADKVIDMRDIQYADNSFDVIVASMVMEHIEEENRALNELHRVLRKGGQCFLTVPVALDMEKTYEDESIISEEQRLKYFGQEDHVRLYGRDVAKRWGQYFSDVVGICPDQIDPGLAEKNGIPKEYTVWILTR